MSEQENFQSTHFGTIAVDPNAVLTFPNGIIQLDDYKHCTRYYVVLEENAKVLCYLQSLEDPDLYFSLIDHEYLGVDYEIDLNDEEMGLLGLESKEDEVLIMLMVYKPLAVDGEEVTQEKSIKAQTQSPLIINPNKRLGFQKVGLNSRLVFSNIGEQ